MKSSKWWLAFTMVGALGASPATLGHPDPEPAAAEPSASREPSFEEALRGGKPMLAVRLRIEDVEQDNLLEDANALTLRGRLGYQTAEWHGLSGLLEFEVVEAFGGEAYNSGPPPNGNGKVTRSVIPDPEGEEVNQWYLQYNARELSNTRFRLGRQRLILDNARHVGNVGWRQNEQTYDAFAIQSKAIPHLEYQYAFLNQLNDIFFRNIEMDGHLVNLALVLPDTTHRLVAYGYFLDFEPVTMTDHRTLGLRGSGDFDLSSLKLGYVLEYARQDDYKEAPSTVDADYRLIELSVAGGPFKTWAGLETLGGDGTYAFGTPLATLHAFNGWADQFLATPVNGLEDRYAGISVKPVSNATLQLIYHDFVSDSGSIDYGSEWNAAIGFTPAPGWSLLAKLADYSADALSVDTRKLWLQMEFSF